MNNLLLALNQQDTVPFELRSFQRGDVLIQTGDIAKYLYIVLEGAIRVTYFEEDINEEHTIRFGYKNSMIASIPSFFDESPSLFSIECIRKSKIKRIHKKDFNQLIQSNKVFQEEYNLFLQAFFKQQIEREIDLLISSPQKRLERVLSRSPQLFQEVPLKYIAAYLRMQPETLSRILKKTKVH